jgi:hypothetical protein
MPHTGHATPSPEPRAQSRQCVIAYSSTLTATR